MKAAYKKQVLQREWEMHHNLNLGINCSSSLFLWLHKNSSAPFFFVHSRWYTEMGDPLELTIKWQKKLQVHVRQRLDSQVMAAS